MSDAEILVRLRRFLLVTAVLLFVGAIVELWLVGHSENAIQWIPFVLCGLGIVVVVAVITLPRRATMRALRVTMVLVFLGSLFGVYEHVMGNVAFLREVNPNADGRETVMAAVGGGNPLLAPGILALAAVLATAVTYQHPVLRKDKAELES